MEDFQLYKNIYSVVHDIPEMENLHEMNQYATDEPTQEPTQEQIFTLSPTMESSIQSLRSQQIDNTQQANIYKTLFIFSVSAFAFMVVYRVLRR